MESRTALRGIGLSKRFVAVALVIAAAVVGIASALVLHATLQGAPGAAAQSQVGSFANGPAWDGSRRHGTQTVGGTELTGAPSYRNPSDQRGGPRD